jgi:hydroxymethylpyrimidine/phosphomethylpyrimidine kinase
MVSQKPTETIVLSIAGSDPSGGAGIQADIKTCTVLGVFCGAAITCLTVQNTRGVLSVHPVAPELVKKQIEYVLEDIQVSHIKIGILGSPAVAVSICDVLANFSGEIIYDPVLVSSSGQKLIEREGYSIIRNKVLPICTVATPNLSELAVLAEQECVTRDQLYGAARKLLQQNKKLRVIIVTGGHFDPGKDSITDFLVTRSDFSTQVECEEICHERIQTRNTHGTGCTFSTAFTAFHLLSGGDDSASFHKAAMYMDNILRKSAHGLIGHGNGPLLHYLK